MSEFPKSFVWHANQSDVITFNGPDDRPFCKQGMQWDWSTMGIVTSPSKWIAMESSPVEMESSPVEMEAELAALRRFRSAVMAATQTESNSRLPQAIFAADAEVRRVTKPEVSHVE